MKITIETDGEMTVARIMSAIQKAGIQLAASPARGIERGIHLKASEPESIRQGKSYQILEMDAYRNARA